MTNFLNTDREIERYDEAELYASTAKPEMFPNIRSKFNVDTGQTDLLAPLPSGGFVRLASQAPDVMMTAPTMPGMGADAALPVEDDEFQLQSIRNFAASGANISSRDDYLAAGYTDQLIDASGVMGETQQETGRTEPLSVGEIKTILREGGTLLQDYTPTMRENGSADLMETLMELSVDRRREELMAQGVDTAEISRIITSEQPEMRSLAENLTDVVFGNKNVLGTGIADFVTAGVMDMQEGYRMLEAGSSFNGGSATQRGLGILLIAAGVAEATGVGMLLGKTIKASIPKIQGAMVSMGQNAELRMAERGTGTTLNMGGDPMALTDPLVAAAGRAVDDGKFAIETKDASSVFGEGAVYKTYTDPASGGLIRVVQRKDGSASVLDLEVPEESQGKGIGQALQAAAMEGNPVLTGQVSSKAAATTAYRLGRRPSGQPDATLDEVFAIIDDMSSVNLVSPAAQPNDGIVAKIDPPTDDTPGIIAFHGSAADFDGFKLEKIGTGEGAQAYGYGLYFADQEDIAKYYRDFLSKSIDVDGKPFIRGNKHFDDALGGDQDLADNLGATQGDLEQAIKEAKETRQEMLDFGNEEAADIYADEVYKLEQLRGRVTDNSSKGRVYKVGLRPKPEDLLDYDKPLSEQPEKYKSALNEIAEIQGISVVDQFGQSASFASFQDALSQKIGPKNAMREFFEAGIPGLKFFDNTSRNTADGKLIDVSEADDGFRAKVAVDNRAGGLGGSGRIVTTSPPYKTKQEALDWADKSIGKKSSNYVIFDDSMIKILEKYGIVGPVAISAMALSEDES
tara:strand:- start:12 stop:2405 length:2394 start_codon:yes stop_codon:yes gene_type:complete